MEEETSHSEDINETCTWSFASISLVRAQQGIGQCWYLCFGLGSHRIRMTVMVGEHRVKITVTIVFQYIATFWDHTLA